MYPEKEWEWTCTSLCPTFSRSFPAKRVWEALLRGCSVEILASGGRQPSVLNEQQEDASARLVTQDFERAVRVQRQRLFPQRNGGKAFPKGALPIADPQDGARACPKCRRG
jgi:hypothetical protein